MAKFKFLEFLFMFIYFFNIKRTNADDKKIFDIMATGSNCTIQEPLYMAVFDFNNLRSDLAHVVSSNPNEKFEFNICGMLSKSCRNVSGVAACYSKSIGTEKKEFVLGYNSTLGIQNGRFDFKFTGERCDAKMNYTLHIILHCDYQTDGDIRVLPYPKDSCSFYIFWATKTACLPEPPSIKEAKCSVKDAENHVYNLMSLSHVNNKVPDRNSSFFIVNVCKPVLFSYDAMCPYGSSICFVDNNAKNISEKFRNFGTVVGNPIIEDDLVMMKFQSNEKCNSTHNITSSMIFPCSHSIKFSDPEFFGKKGCEYKFIWNTPVTCKPVTPCLAVNPITEQIYNLTSLSGKIYNVDHQNLSYTFGICEIPDTLLCYKNAGICQQKDKVVSSMGLINNILYLNETGWPYLLYESGASCQKFGVHWQTKIEFICAKGGIQVGPKIIENTNCEIVIQFATELACPLNQINCELYDNDSRKISLEPLISSTHNYKANINKTLNETEGAPVEYYLNICRPLVPQYGLNCHGSAACRVIHNITAENEIGLGFADLSLTLVHTPNGSRPQLKYLRGDICPDDSTTNISTTIEFCCEPKAGKGNPILQEIIDHCHYSFTWATNIICPDYTTEFKPKTCEMYNSQTEVKFDLKKIPINKIISDTATNKQFNISFCNSSDFTATVRYEESSVDMFFSTSDPCGSDGKVVVMLKLVCNDEEYESVKILESQCEIIVTYNTPLVCPFIGITLEHKNTTENTNKTDNNKNNDNKNNNNDINNHTDSIIIENTGISTTGLVFLLLFTSVFVATIVYVAKSPIRRSKIMSLFKRQTVGVQYTRVRTNEEASLLLFDSDDDLLI